MSQEKCVNCSVSFIIDESSQEQLQYPSPKSSSTKVFEISLDWHFETNQEDRAISLDNVVQEPKSIKIQNVLSSIYNLNCDDDDVAMCQGCSNVLTRLYRCHQEFNSLREVDSYLAKKFANLDSVLKLNNQNYCVIKEEPQVFEAENVEIIPEIAFKESLSNFQNEGTIHSPVPPDNFDGNDGESLSSIKFPYIKLCRIEDDPKFAQAVAARKCLNPLPADDPDNYYEQLPSKRRTSTKTKRSRKADTSTTELESSPSVLQVNDNSDEEFKPNVKSSRVRIRSTRIKAKATERIKLSDQDDDDLEPKVAADNIEWELGNDDDFPSPDDNDDDYCSNDETPRPKRIKSKLKSSKFESSKSKSKSKSSKSKCKPSRSRKSTQEPSSSSQNTESMQEKYQRQRIDKVYKRKKFTKPNPCWHCKEDSFATPEECLEHTKAVHLVPGDLLCQKCSRISKTKISFSNHQKQCESLLPGQTLSGFPCSKCPKVFPVKYYLLAHMKSHNETIIMQCDKCEFTTKNEFSLKSHKNRMHIERMLEQILCSFCGKLFRNKHNLRMHQVKMHTEEGYKRYREQQRVLLLRQKEQRKAAKTKKSTVCEFCNVDCFNNLALVFHKRKYHSEDFEKNLKFLCHQCSKGFARAATLRHHIEFSHSEQRSFICEVCSKGFKTAPNLKDHIRRTHTEEGRLEYNKFMQLHNKMRKLRDQAVAKTRNPEHLDHAAEQDNLEHIWENSECSCSDQGCTSTVPTNAMGNSLIDPCFQMPQPLVYFTNAERARE